jgi:hypothetical protein
VRREQNIISWTFPTFCLKAKSPPYKALTSHISGLCYLVYVGCGSAGLLPHTWYMASLAEMMRGSSTAGGLNQGTIASLGSINLQFSEGDWNRCWQCSQLTRIALYFFYPRCMYSLSFGLKKSKKIILWACQLSMSLDFNTIIHSWYYTC